MKKRYLFTLLAILMAVRGLAQTVYVTQRANDSLPELIKAVSHVCKIAYSDAEATVYFGDHLSRVFPLSEISGMGMHEVTSVNSQMLPAQYASIFDYNIDFAPDDYTLATQGEPVVTDEKDKEYDDFVEHTLWAKHITITFAEGKVTVSGDHVDGLSYTVNDGHIVVTNTNTTENVELTLTGKADNGSFKLYSDRKMKVVFSNLTLTNPSGPAVNSQSKKRLFLVLQGINTLTDSDTYATAPKGADGKKEDQRGCIFAEGKLCISGDGQLVVNGHKKGCIASDDYVHQVSGYIRANNTPVKGKAIYGKEQVIIGGGALQISCSGAAAKGIDSDSLICIRGGKSTIITTGDARYEDEKHDYSSSSCIKCVHDMTLSGGVIACMSTGIAGKGISTDGKLTVSDAKIHVRTLGARIPEVKHEDSHGNKADSISSSPKGIKAEGNILIESGEIYVRCSGGSSAEGIESKKTLTLNGGKVYTYCVDDGINCEGCYMNGGEVFICSSANDGLDSQFFVQKGGSLYTIGAHGEQMGLDTDGKTCTFTGGQVVAIGANNCWSNGSCTVPSILCFIQKADRDVSYLQLVHASDGQVVKTLQMPTAGYKQLSILLADSAITVGDTYKILSYAHTLQDTPTLEYEPFEVTSTSTTVVGKYDKYNK